MSVSTKPASGMRDFSAAELIKRKYLINKIEETYRLYGFVPLETPAIENLTTLLGKYGDEGDQLLFKILHRRDKLSNALLDSQVTEKNLADLGLRYDLTVPLARYTANNANLPKYYKRYQIQPVWRADRPGKGRYREFLQCDIDITGTKSLIADAEVCGAVAHVLLSLGFNQFKIHINHRALLKNIIQKLNIANELETEALTAIDKLDKIGQSGVLNELKERGISDQSASKLLEITSRSTGNSDLEELSRIQKELDNPDANNIIEQLSDLLRLLEQGKAKNHCFIDFSLARGLGYYTGSIFEIRAEGVSGSIGGGGRYDGLIGMFKGRQIPAVGFSIGFERLFILLEEKEMFNQLVSIPQVLLCHLEDAPITMVLQTAQRLRENGISTEIYPDSQKLQKQMAYCNSINAKYAAIIGAQEAEKGQITLKNLDTGEQKALSIAHAIELINTIP